MKQYLFVGCSLIFFCFLINEAKSNREDVDHFIEDEVPINKDSKDGPVKIEIVGDTNHLFADEDFEKKEVVLLHDNVDSDENVSKNNQSIELDPIILAASLNDSATINSTNNNKTLVKKKNTSSNPHQPDCLNSNLTILRENNTVQFVNGSRLTRLLSESENTKCFLVLFYVPWCPFSTRLAPIYNALPRAFANLNILAFDISRSIG
jgi:hypothetical protein